MKPKRKDILLVEGAIFVQPGDVEMTRIEGKLSKTPSFWTRRVEVVRKYERKAGVRVPISIESVAHVLIAGRSTFKMTYEYQTINGQQVGNPQVPGTEVRSRKQTHRINEALMKKLLVAVALTFVAQGVPPATAQTAVKKPITHDVYDSWKSIQGTKLSGDGVWLAYALTPQDGDGELVVRNLKTNAEIRAARGRDPLITLDNHFVVFAVAPYKKDVDQARKAKKKPEDMPKSRRRHRQPLQRSGDDRRRTREELSRSG